MALQAVPASANSPPYPADTRAGSYRFQLDNERIAQSTTWRLAGPEVRPWLLMLWREAWLQIPCGALPDSDEEVALIIGMSPAAFAVHKPVLMRGWRRHSDGRRYHDSVITPMVLAMLHERSRFRERQTKHRNVTRDTPVTAPSAQLIEMPDVTRDAPVTDRDKGAAAPQTSKLLIPQMSQTDVDVDVKSKSKAKTASRPKSTEGKRLDLEWECPEDWIGWALRYRTDWDELRVRREALVFRDYWHAKAGQRARMVDWFATWRNWIRRAT